MSRRDPTSSHAETTPLAARSLDDTRTLRAAAGAALDGADLPPGALLAGRYRVVARIGQGGMGSVYRAHDLVLGQSVALKLIQGRTDDRAVERLTDEVRIGRRVTHPNVCRLHDVVEADGRRFLVMEFVDGENLASLLGRMGPLPYETALSIARGIAAGVAAAHAEGIVHRDLKPGNVMIDGRGRAHVTDFGLAVAADVAREREVAGTPAYMAPEQFRGEPPSARADVYALGLLLLELLTGQRLNEGRTVAEIRDAPAAVPTSLAVWTPQVDPALERFVLRSLDPDPSRRPSSASELLAVLGVSDPLASALAAGETPTPEMVAAAARTGRLRRPVALALVIAIVAGLAAAAKLSERVRLYHHARVPPAALESCAREAVGRIAPGFAARASAWWFEAESAPSRSDPVGAVPSGGGASAEEPRRLRFVFRQADRDLVPRGVSDTVSSLFIMQSGRVTLDDPPLSPGMATVLLDGEGRLLRADAMTAAGRLLSEPPGPRAIRPREAPSPLSRLSASLQVVMMVGSLGAAIVLAVRNRRRGLGDGRGAARLATWTFATLLLSWIFACGHVSDAAEEARLFSVGFGSAATAAVLLWIFYLALEPYVRRRFPEALVSWSRLLNGRIRDSLVARDLLLGIAGGVAGRLLLDAARASPLLWGGRVRVAGTLEAIGPLRRMLGNFLVLQVDALEIAIGMLFLLAFLVRAVRRTWLAAALCALLLAGASVASPALLAYVALLFAVLLRLGLLSAVVTNVVAGILPYAAITPDPTAWFFARSAATLGALAAVAVVLAVLAARSPAAPAAPPRSAV